MTLNSKGRSMRPNAKEWARLVWLPPLIAGAAYLVLDTLGRQYSFVQLWLVALTGVALLILIGKIRQDPFPEPKRHRAHEAVIFDRPFADVNRWEDRLSWSVEDVDRFRRIVQHRMAELIAERLRLRHGVSLVDHPQHAHAILGDGLYLLATQPMRYPLTGHELEYIIRSIEEI